MKRLLYTCGDSFTYGSGLIFHLWKDEYPEIFERFKYSILSNKTYNQVCNDMVTFNNFRINNNYSNLLNKKLGTELVTNSVNGRSNPNRISDLINFLDFLDSQSEVNLDYCIFQLSYASRDIGYILNHAPWDCDPELLFGKEFCDSIKDVDFTGNNEWKLDKLLEKVLLKMIDVITEKFDVLKKKYGTKCLFFYGNGDHNLIIKVRDTVLRNPYFFDVVKDDVSYSSWLHLCEKTDTTLRKTFDVHDDHPNLESNKWLSEQLFNKLIG